MIRTLCKTMEVGLEKEYRLERDSWSTVHSTW